jgi:hypothetical protein
MFPQACLFPAAALASILSTVRGAPATRRLPLLLLLPGLDMIPPFSRAHTLSPSATTVSDTAVEMTAVAHLNAFEPLPALVEARRAAAAPCLPSIPEDRALECARAPVSLSISSISEEEEEEMEPATTSPRAARLPLPSAPSTPSLFERRRKLPSLLNVQLPVEVVNDEDLTEEIFTDEILDTIFLSGIQQEQHSVLASAPLALAAHPSTPTRKSPALLSFAPIKPLVLFPSSPLASPLPTIFMAPEKVPALYRATLPDFSVVRRPLALEAQAPGESAAATTPATRAATKGCSLRDAGRSLMRLAAHDESPKAFLGVLAASLGQPVAAEPSAAQAPAQPQQPQTTSSRLLSAVMLRGLRRCLNNPLAPSKGALRRHAGGRPPVPKERPLSPRRHLYTRFSLLS